ncbi:MAG: hypothetical protein H6Q10_3550 [Acidobacteria bacterium]|nr:hypothetical protein [Acidobacteriota bacterium]
MARTRTPGKAEWGWGRSAVGFRSAYLDFDRGIRVGNLEDHERITGILKGALESRFRTPFVTERYGRGVFWQWIGYLARENRAAKPISSGVSFGCSKFFIEVDTGERRFKCGLQVERGYVRPPKGSSWFRLRPDWDWHRLHAGLRPRAPLMRELSRLVRDGFEIHAGTWADPHVFAGGRLPSAARLRALLDEAAAGQWCGFQAYYALDEADVRAIPGPELVDVMVAVFDEVAPALSLCSQVRLPPADSV